jgi:hypothetical protein
VEPTEPQPRIREGAVASSHRRRRAARSGTIGRGRAVNHTNKRSVRGAG